MALPMKLSFLLFLLTLLSSSHQILARDSQFFNKIPSNNNNNAAAGKTAAAYEIQPKQEEDPLDKLEQEEEEPNFIPQNNQNAAYGLYGQESESKSAAQLLPPSNTIKNTNNHHTEFLPRYLPKNYNTVAYVTEPEGYHPPTQETNTNSNYYYQSQETETNTNNNYNNYPYQTQNQEDDYPATTSAINYYQNYNGQQQQQQGVNQYNLGGQKSYPTTTSGAINRGQEDSNNNNNVDVAANKQGMSDTRFLENGKYFYDINLERNTNGYPLGDNTRRSGDQYHRKYGAGYYNYYGNNNNNNNDINSNDGGYYGNVNQDFQQDDDEGLGLGLP